MSSSSQRYRCVAFDAVGTLIDAVPSVPEVYQQIGGSYGCELDIETIKQRFYEVFSKRKLEESTSEESEFQYWRGIVGEVIGSVEQADACFQELYKHFAKPEAWTVSEHAAETISELHAHGILVAVASNFDLRLHTVLDGHKGLREISIRIISSEIGWRKPSPSFYEELCIQSGFTPAEILMVGDDLRNDVLAARTAGLAALHYRPNNQRLSDSFVENVTQIHSLEQVTDHCFTT